MLCEQCNKEPSTVLITRITGGAREKQQLCRHCAEPVLERIQPTEVIGATFLSPVEAHPPQELPAEIRVEGALTVEELAVRLNMKPYQVIGTFIRLGVHVAAVDTVEVSTAERLCALYGVTVATSAAA
jgi:hypothetical protein